MVSRSSALALLLLAGATQSMGFRAHRSDTRASKEEGEFVPFSRPRQAAAAGVQKSAAVEPQFGTFGVGSKSLTQRQALSYRQALRSVRMDASIESSTAGEDSMRELALAAMDSNGDPSQLAVFMVEETNETVEVLKQTVLEKAKSMSGVTQPMGFFDPVGFCTDCSEGKLCFYREVELKHGRVGMLASLGFLVGEKFHPLFGGDIDVPSYLAFQQTPLQTFWPAVVAAIAIPEVLSVFTFSEVREGAEKWTMKTNRIPGDLGFDPLNLKPEDPEEFKELQTKEINNGRLAMLAAAGMIAQELATGEKLSLLGSMAPPGSGAFAPN
jgi:hypothetical protein